MSEIIKFIYEITAGVLAVIGLASCIYYIFFKRRLCTKGGACLILDVDGAGERLEYYIRRITSDIKINKIVLYSKSGKPEPENICGILLRDYPYIKFHENINLKNLIED